MNNNIEEWISIRDAALHTGLSIGFFRKAVRERRVPFARAGNKALRFRRSELDRWLESNGYGGQVRQKTKVTEGADTAVAKASPDCCSAKQN